VWGVDCRVGIDVVGDRSVFLPLGAL